MFGRRIRVTTTAAALAALSLAVLAMAGCGDSYKAGASFRNSEYAQETPEGAVSVWLGSMEWKTNEETGQRDPGLGRNFDAFRDVSDPALFEDANGQTASQEDLDKLAENWNSPAWEVELLDIQLETVSQEGDGEGDIAVVKITGGQVRYIGKEMFGTSEYKVDDFRDKPGEITVKKIDGSWRVIKGAFIPDDEYWETQEP